MSKKDISDYVIANEIINALDNSNYSEETKNSIICDYLDTEYRRGFKKGREELIADIYLITKESTDRKLLEAIIKKTTTRNGSL